MAMDSSQHNFFRPGPAAGSRGRVHAKGEGRSKMSSFNWYHKAKVRAEKFLPGLDRNLEVDVEETSISPYDGGAEYQTYALVFSHESNPNLNWTMEVQENDDFVENELEAVVKKIYFQRVE